MRRYLHENILKDLRKKMVLITGPRQVGKTYLAKMLQSEFKSPCYLNYDNINDAAIINAQSWPAKSDLIIFDEIHKKEGWKKFLKGTFDTRPAGQSILVTGSARMETFRQAGDSLAGRYFHYRLNPLSVKEIRSSLTPRAALAKLISLGGFPEPFLSDSEDEARRWRKQYYTDLVREDILDFSKIQEIRAIRLLLELLRKRVGSPISYLSLSRDLQISPNTICKYIAILESLYIIFLIKPFHKNIARAILKEPKVYFYDTGFIDADEGIRLENTVALCLLKHTQYQQDSAGVNTDLYYIKTKEKKEVDFAISEKGALKYFIEAKLSDANLSPQIKYFKQRFPTVEAIQLVYNLKQEKEIQGVSILAADKWLADLAAQIKHLHRAISKANFEYALYITRAAGRTGWIPSLPDSDVKRGSS